MKFLIIFFLSVIEIYIAEEKFSTYVCAEANEMEALKLQCPIQTIVESIDFASWGTANGKCGSYTKGNCHSDNSAAAVLQQCKNKNSCEFIASNQVFGEPCYLTPKYFRVQARCALDESLQIQLNEDL
jgi:hypothetical protein